MDYSLMVTVLTTDAYDHWFARITDMRTRTRILARIRRLALGNFGDWKSVGGRVGEIRIDHGPGYRLYFMRRGAEVIVLLAGGDKASQARDIKMAQSLAERIQEGWI